MYCKGGSVLVLPPPLEPALRPRAASPCGVLLRRAPLPRHPRSARTAASTREQFGRCAVLHNFEEHLLVVERVLDLREQRSERCLALADEIAESLAAHEDAALGILGFVTGVDPHSGVVRDTHEQRERALEPIGPGDRDFVPSRRNRGCPRHFRRPDAVFERKALEPAVDVQLADRARGRVLVAHQPKLHPDPPCRPVHLPAGRPTAARIISRARLVRYVGRRTRSLVVVRDPAASASVRRPPAVRSDGRIPRGEFMTNGAFKLRGYKPPQPGGS